MANLTKHYHHHYHFSYITSFKRHFLLLGLLLLIIVIILLFIFHSIAPARQLINPSQLSITDLISASLATMYRLSVAYIISLILSIPLALVITSSPKAERFLLPFFDILQSVPTLAFFPIIVLFFIKVNFFDGAAIFVLFMAMLWNIVFSMIGGLKTIPEDINSAAFVFKTKGLTKLWRVTLPAIFPYIVTGSLLAWAQGWNITIIAEVLHNYIPNGSPSQDLYGLGSLMVNASANGKNFVFIVTLITMIILIVAINFFIWQKLLHLAERYKFE